MPKYTISRGDRYDGLVLEPFLDNFIDFFFIDGSNLLQKFILQLVKSQETKTSLDYHQVTCYLTSFYYCHITIMIDYIPVNPELTTLSQN